MTKHVVAAALAMSLVSAGVAPSIAHADEPPTRMHSPGLVAGGAVLTTIGAVSLIGAVAVFVTDLRERGDFRGLASVVIGLPLLSSALGGLGGGIPMIAIGLKSVPLDPSYASSTARPIGATLSWTF